MDCHLDLPVVNVKRFFDAFEKLLVNRHLSRVMDRKSPRKRADVTDPREEYEDLIIEWEKEQVSVGDFSDAREMEAFLSRWVAVGAVFDENGRILLAYNENDEQWLLPGGSLQPHESLREGLVREVHEETGITAAPVRPRAIKGWVIQYEDEQTGFNIVFSKRKQ